MVQLQISSNGVYAKDFFNHRGDLLHIKDLTFWPLKNVLEDKYRLVPDEVSTNLLTVSACCQSGCAMRSSYSTALDSEPQ